MNNYSFQFGEEYQGYWNIPFIGENIPGTLHIEKHIIHLDLFWNQYSGIGKAELPTATGYAYTKDNKTCYHFTLYELFRTHASSFGERQSQFSFEVAHFTISDTKNIIKDNIKSLCIRTRLLDKWVYDYTRNSFNYNIPADNTESMKFEYKPKRSLTLYKTEDMRVNIFFGYGETTPSYSGFSMTTRAFLNVDFKNTISFDKAFCISEYLIWLFALIWNNKFCPDFVAYRTKEYEFINKQSDRYSYKYHDNQSANISTDISDISAEQLSSIIGEWIEFIDNYNDPLNTFFETLFNGHLSPLSVIKNHIFTIDGLSAEFRGKSNGQIKEGKRKKELDDILKKIEAGLDKVEISKDDFNKLKTAALGESNKTLKERFSCLLETIKDYVNLDIEEQFCDKVINTRNHFTHLKGKAEEMYPKTQFWELSQCLEKIISSFILNSIGVEPATARKIVRKITMKDEK
ncbi:MAG: hypothetical protein J5705_02335 [Bacteroidaceae bacterium]|nr:hypothetical protein [Bacteroidaceae bacterium]